MEPSELNRQWAQTTQRFAEEKLGRPLSEDESYKIWNIGSFHLLEQIDMAIYFAKSADEIQQCLREMPRPEGKY